MLRGGLLMLVCVAAACGGDERDGSTNPALVTDSAGTRVVTHPAATAAPVEVIGPARVALSRDDEVDYLFSSIAGVVALADGRVAVGERDGTIRVYEVNGDLALRAGGAGDGPGEFAFLSIMRGLPGDTIAAYDGRRSHTLFFTSEGEYVDQLVSSGRFGGVPEGSSQCFFPNVQDVRDDHRAVMFGFQCVFAEGRAGPRDYIADVAIVDPDEVGMLTRVPILTVTEDPGADGPRGQFQMPAVYGRPTLAASGDLTLVAIPSLGYRIRGFDNSGQLVLDLRDETPEPALTAELQAAVEAGWSPPLAEIYEGAPWPATLEGWDTLRVMSDGTIWARTLHIPADTTGAVWTVYSADGEQRRRFRVPVGFELHDVRDGLVWGVTRDDLDVEDVVAYPLPDESED